MGIGGPQRPVAMQDPSRCIRQQHHRCKSRLRNSYPDVLHEIDGLLAHDTIVTAL